jgi:hypothetical protein
MPPLSVSISPIRRTIALAGVSVLAIALLANLALIGIAILSNDADPKGLSVLAGLCIASLIGASMLWRAARHEIFIHFASANGPPCPRRR